MGVECVSAIEAINVIVEDDYVEKAKAIQAIATPKMIRLVQDNPAKIQEYRGKGVIYGITLKESFLKGAQSLAGFLPLKMTSDKNFMHKLYLSSIMSKMFKDYNVLICIDSHKRVPLVISFSMITSIENVKYVLE